jgi:hypothetical protein
VDSSYKKEASGKEKVRKINILFLLLSTYNKFGNTFLEVWCKILQNATMDIQRKTLQTRELDPLVSVLFGMKQLQDVAGNSILSLRVLETPSS